MREIKFRGKRLDNGEWVYGYYELCGCLVGTIEEEIYSVIHEFYKGSYKVDPSTVGQYTGLKDKNGKEIYIGDILGGIEKMGTDTYGGGTLVNCARWENKVKHIVKYDISSMSLTDYYCRFTDVEVVGNIHDTPELLKEESQC